MRLNRSSGLLLHPTSLPGPFGIGDLGPAAHAFVDLLAAARQSLWQVLPLGPTGYGDSPYQSLSAFAGNPLLLSPESLVTDGLLEPADLATTPAFGDVIPWKRGLLDRAAARFAAGSPPALAAEDAAFRERAAGWLDDFTLFMAIKDAHGGEAWNTWDAPLRRRDPAALAAARTRLADGVARHAFLQFAFDRQWRTLRLHARERGVRFIGDAPIFVALDSADVWAHPELFHLDAHGQPTVVAGVPPDYFSATGQRWGNPHYRWDRLAAEGYAWWVARVRAALEQVDTLRLDHFVGFVRAWEIPAHEPTAVRGRWVEGPGAALFEAIERTLGPTALIAEDLGAVTPAVTALRERFAYPGMKILQFGFGGGAGNPFLPHHYEPNCVVYTGTHDNDTAAAWYAQADDHEKDFARRYLGSSGSNFAWDLLRCAWASCADTAIAPVQDVLGAGPEARMNLPGRPSGNWSWRMRAGEITGDHVQRLAELTTLFGRDGRAAREPAP